LSFAAHENPYEGYTQPATVSSGAQVEAVAVNAMQQ
jgi:hypothetical protein